MDLPTALQILDSMIRLGTPLLLACLAGLFSERAGIFDIGLEGKMLSAAFLSAAIIELSWSVLWHEMEQGRLDPAAIEARPPRLPKTIDFTVDYLRSGLPRDAYARARVNRSGRRYASVHVEAWQDNRARPIAQATGHFLMPDREG